MVLAWMQARAPAHHLAVQASDLCRAQDYDAVHAWTVPSLGQQHGVAQDVISSSLKICQHLSPILALAVYLGCLESILVQDIPELLAGLHQWKECHRLFIHAVVLHFFRYAAQVWIKRGSNIPRIKVSTLNAYAAHIDLERYRDRLDRRQAAFLYSLWKRVFISMLQFCQNLYDDINQNLNEWVAFTDYEDINNVKRKEILNRVGGR